MATFSNTVGYSDAAATQAGDYTSIAGWLAARKGATRAAGDIEELVLLDYSGASNRVHNFSGTSWNSGWSTAAGETHVLIKAQNPHGGSWSGTAVTNNSFTTLAISDHQLTLEFEDLVFDQGGTGSDAPILQIGGTHTSKNHVVNVRRCLGDIHGSVVADNTDNGSGTSTITFEDCVFASPDTNGRYFARVGYSATNTSNVTFNLNRCTLDNVRLDPQRNPSNTNVNTMTVNGNGCLIYMDSGHNGGQFVDDPVTNGTVTGNTVDCITSESSSIHTTWAAGAVINANYDTTFNRNGETPATGEVSWTSAATDQGDYSLVSHEDNLAFNYITYSSGGTTDMVGFSRTAYGNADAGGLEAQPDASITFELRNTGSLYTGHTLSFIDSDDQTGGARRWVWGDGSSDFTAPSDSWPTATHEYSSTGSYSVRMFKDGVMGTPQTLTLADLPDASVSITGSPVSGNEYQFTLTPSGATNASVTFGDEAAATQWSYDYSGPSDVSRSNLTLADVQSTKWTLRSHDDQSLFVYGHERSIASSLTSSIWEEGQTTGIEQSWATICSDGETSFYLGLVDGSNITSLDIYPKNLCTVTNLGTAKVKVTAPNNKRFFIVANGDESQPLILSHNPMPAATPGTTTDFTSKVHAAAAAVDGANSAATGFVVPSMDFSGRIAGDQFRVLLHSSSTLPAVLDPGGGKLRDYEITVAEVVDPGLDLIKLVDHDGNDIIFDVNESPPSTGYFITEVDHRSTTSALVFPAGIHHIGRGFRVGPLVDGSMTGTDPCTVHLERGAYLIGSFDFVRYTDDITGGAGYFDGGKNGWANGTDRPLEYSTRQGTGQNIHIQGAGNITGRYITREELETDQPNYQDGFFTQKDQHAMFYNSGYGGIWTSNSIQDATVAITPYYFDKRGFSSITNITMVSPWYFNADGPQLHVPKPAAQGRGADNTGTMADSLFWCGDDAVKLTQYGGAHSVSNTFFIGVGNACINGAYFPRANGYDTQTTVNNVDLMHFGQGDVDAYQTGYPADNPTSTPQVVGNATGSRSMLRVHTDGYQFPDPNDAGHVQSGTVAADANAGVFNISLQGFSVAVDLSGSNTYQGATFNWYITIGGNDYSVTSGTTLSNGSSFSVTLVEPLVANITAGDTVEAHVPGFTGNGILGEDYDPFYPSYLNPDPTASDYKAMDWTVNNVRVWGACSQRPITIGNVIYPFGGVGNMASQRQQYGRLEGFTADNWTFEQLPTQKSVIAATDSTNRPTGVNVTGWDMAGTSLDDSNKATYWDIDPLVTDATFDTAGTTVLNFDTVYNHTYSTAGFQEARVQFSNATDQDSSAFFLNSQNVTRTAQASATAQFGSIPTGTANVTSTASATATAVFGNSSSGFTQAQQSDSPHDKMSGIGPSERSINDQ